MRDLVIVLLVILCLYVLTKYFDIDSETTGYSHYNFDDMGPVDSESGSKSDLGLDLGLGLGLKSGRDSKIKESFDNGSIDNESNSDLNRCFDNDGLESGSSMKLSRTDECGQCDGICERDLQFPTPNCNIVPNCSELLLNSADGEASQVYIQHSSHDESGNSHDNLVLGKYYLGFSSMGSMDKSFVYITEKQSEQNVQCWELVPIANGNGCDFYIRSKKPDNMNYVPHYYLGVDRKSSQLFVSTYGQSLNQVWTIDASSGSIISKITCEYLGAVKSSGVVSMFKEASYKYTHWSIIQKVN